MYDENHHPLAHADRRHLVRAAARLLGAAEAEDVVQDAYERALGADTSSLNTTQAWLHTVVRNLAIDRLRRRQWMQQWLADATAGGTAAASPSAESNAALAQETTRALRLLAAQLAPVDGAALLLHEVFDISHDEIAAASGRSEAASRQQLRRALLRLRAAQQAQEPQERNAHKETVFRLYLQALQGRDPQALWAMLRQPPISALANAPLPNATTCAATPQTITSGVVQMGGQLGLVLSLDGVRLCVLPLGVRHCPTEEAPSTLAV